MSKVLSLSSHLKRPLFKGLIAFLIVLLGLYFPIPNIYRALGFILLPLVVFWPIRREEVLVFLFASLFFAIQDYFAIRAGFFVFSEPDIFSLPYWELVAWGFWTLLAYRSLEGRVSHRFDFRFLLLAIVFGASFSLGIPKPMILVITTAVLVVALFLGRHRDDFIYVGFYSVMGAAVEAVGLMQGLWSYPGSHFYVAVIQFVVMWAGVGFFFRNLVGPFLCRSKSS